MMVRVITICISWYHNLKSTQYDAASVYIKADELIGKELVAEAGTDAAPAVERMPLSEDSMA